MLNRLMGIVYILLRKENVTAAELAERFEVSVRTIYRDVEAISMAGIPIFTRKGKNGGISLTEQFVLDKLLVTKKEQEQILSALVTFNATGAEAEGETLRKLRDFFQLEPRDWVAFDFSDWSGCRKELYDMIKQAILLQKLLVFDYYGQDGSMSHRKVEPVQLFFKDYTWYLRAYCLTRHAMRMFKLVRMKRAEVQEQGFHYDGKKYQEQEASSKPDPDGRIINGSKLVTLWISSSEAYRIYDRFEDEEITVLEDGNFMVQSHCFPDDWVYGLILSFGPNARVLGPEDVKVETTKRLRQMLDFYETII